jgi:transposase-like protein
MGTRNREEETKWRGRMARYQSDRMTVAEFCRREGTSVASFYYWRKRLQVRGKPRACSEDESTGKTNQLFVPVAVSCWSQAEIEFPSGVRVRVPAANAEAIRAAVLAGGDPYQEGRSC